MNILNFYDFSEYINEANINIPQLAKVRNNVMRGVNFINKLKKIKN